MAYWQLLGACLRWSLTALLPQSAQPASGHLLGGRFWRRGDVEQHRLGQIERACTGATDLRSGRQPLVEHPVQVERAVLGLPREPSLGEPALGQYSEDRMDLLNLNLLHDQHFRASLAICQESIQTRGVPFKEWLADQIRQHGWAPVDAAREIGIDESLMSRYLNGKRLPSRQTAKKIAACFGVTLPEVLEAIDRQEAQTIARPPPRLDNLEYVTKADYTPDQWAVVVEVLRGVLNVAEAKARGEV